MTVPVIIESFVFFSLMSFFFPKQQESIVEQLEQRYMNGVVYTYIGDILVAINPFAELNIYGDKVIG